MERILSTVNGSQQASDLANEYRYKRFTTSLLFRDLRFARTAAGPGDAFPSFDLVATDGSHLTNSIVFGDKPVLMIFGSMTCPMKCGNEGTMSRQPSTTSGVHSGWARAVIEVSIRTVFGQPAGRPGSTSPGYVTTSHHPNSPQQYRGVSPHFLRFCRTKAA